jgi:hypothetical protein
MNTDFKKYGFAWPVASTVKNYSGQEMVIKPEYVRSDYQDIMDERQKECCRIYATPLGLMSELEIKHWLAGENFEMDLIKAYQKVFEKNVKTELPITVVLEELDKCNFDEISIQVVVGWLIKGHYVRFDPVKMVVSDIIDKRGE